MQEIAGRRRVLLSAAQTLDMWMPARHAVLAAGATRKTHKTYDSGERDRVLRRDIVLLGVLQF